MSPATPPIGGTGDKTRPSTSENTGVLLADMAQLAISDEQPAAVNTQISGSYAINQTTANGNSYSPSTQRYSSDFVRNGAQSQSEDPFGPSTQPTRCRSAVISTPRAARILKEPNWRSGSNSSEDDSNSSPLNSRSQDSRPKSFHVVSDSPGSRNCVYDVIRAENAQSVYPPSCCVFVANLLQSEPEASLEMAVTQIFREYGPVYVKIRRDRQQMPFAFCQYTKPEHAERAIREGRGRLVKGRPCRCEKAKAHRLFFIERKFGPTITPEEAQNLLGQFGKIDLCYEASPVERTALSLNEGVMVQFQMYDEGQAAQSAFRNHDMFKLQPINGLGSPARAANAVRSPSSDSARAYLARYEIDRRSVFVGNLPVGINEDEIKNIFEQYGQIQEIIIKESASKFEGQEKVCFAFVEFVDPISVSNAMSKKESFTLSGKALRVSQKDSEASRHRSNRYQVPAASPHRRIEQQVSPLSQISPPVYGSPYGYPYSPSYYSYAPSPFTEVQGYYHSAPYSPAYYSYTGSPSYDPRVAGVAEVSGSPRTLPGCYGYPPYQYSPTPYWGVANPSMEQQTAATATYYPSAYAPSMVGHGAPAEDRSTTPTPTGHSPTTEEPLEAAQ